MKLIALLLALLAPKSYPVDLSRLTVHGTEFREVSGKPFVWRGITAFRLVEFVANGKEREAAAYMDWAARRGITVLRVLAMAQHLFQLPPDRGLRALPRVLQMAAERGLYVEVVALADTDSFAVDLESQVRAVGRIAAAHPNAIVEIANEPFHPTQHPRVRDRATLARLAALVPDEVVVAWGSDAPEASGGGEYVTVHMPRGGGWEHVTALAQGRELVKQYGRPVVSDEPIGAGPTRQPGRRDNSPERFRAAALLTRMSGMQATFHYEGGLLARIPSGIELACFNAWRQAWTLLPPNIEQGSFRRLESARGVAFESELGSIRYVLTIGDGKAALSKK